MQTFAALGRLTEMDESLHRSSRHHGQPAGRFGTFGGVFTPCTLTILGVILFLRLGQVVGQAGILHAVAIVFIAKLITVLTSLSLSAIATNTRVRGGGAYFLISRSLGIEFGGSIGMVFFLAQAIAVAMYVIGFSEALVAAMPGDVPLTYVATFVNIAVFLTVFVGAGWTVKVQYLVLAALTAAVVSFYAGAIGDFSSEQVQQNLEPHYTDGESFFTMFALFFPAVTGIMAGANMSGDLKDPRRAIPLGTLWAVAVTGVIYLSSAAILGGVRPHEDLVSDPLIMNRISAHPQLIVLGIFAATISSALASMMGAPRVLQAFARDHIFHRLRWLAKGSGRNNEPRRAIVLTFVISEVGILIADLNAIAPIITIAFMITYGMINFATFCESVARNPSYRPAFQFSHWSTSLAGTLACLGVMFLISWLWASISVSVMAALYWWISHQEVASRWGNVRRGLLFERARHSLIRLEHEPVYPKNWRPVILALSGADWNRPHLAAYGHWFTAGRGVLSLGQVIHGEIEDRIARRLNQERALSRFIKEHELEAFPAVVVAPELFDGIEYLVQCHGLGSMRPNTILLGWPEHPDRAQEFGEMLRTVAELDCSILAIRFHQCRDHPWHAPPGDIDVWWRGKANGALMLLMAHLLSQNEQWRGRPIRLLRCIENADEKCEVEKNLVQLINAARIRATPVVVVGDHVQATIQEYSRPSAIIFLGFDPPTEDGEAGFYTAMEDFGGNLHRVVFVHSAGGVSLVS